MGILWLIIMCLAWGGWGYFDKKGADLIGIPATVLVAFVVSLPMEAYYLFQIKALPAIRDCWPSAVTSVCGMVGGIAFLHSTRYVSGGTAVAIQALYPAVSFLLFILLDGEKITALKLVGLVLATVSAFCFSLGKN
jgi:drug/metabolite transporter (DMT)-like permease